MKRKNKYAVRTPLELRLVAQEEADRFAILTRRFMDELTPRQREVLHYWLRGWSYKLIGRHLDITERTVETTLTMARARMGNPSKTTLVRWMAKVEDQLNKVDEV